MRKVIGVAALVASVFVTGCSAFQKTIMLPPGGPVTGKQNATCNGGSNQCDIIPVPARVGDGIHCIADASYNVTVNAGQVIPWLVQDKTGGLFEFQFKEDRTVNPPLYGVEIQGLTQPPDFTSPGYTANTSNMGYQWTATSTPSDQPHSYLLHIQFRPKNGTTWGDCTTKDPTIVNLG